MPPGFRGAESEDSNVLELDDGVEIDVAKLHEAQRLCDPFWDVHGALDADLAGVAPAVVAE